MNETDLNQHDGSFSYPGTNNVYITVDGEPTTVWYYTPSEREGATIGDVVYDCPNAASTTYGYAIANDTGLSKIRNVPINVIRWRLSPEETNTSGVMHFAVIPIGAQTYTKFLEVEFTAENIKDSWVTCELDEPFYIGDNETFVMQPVDSNTTASSIKIAILRSSVATTTDEYINIYNSVPTKWTNSGNYITRLGLCVDLGYKGFEGQNFIKYIEDDIVEIVENELKELDLPEDLNVDNLNGIYYGYDFTDNVNGTPNFDTTALQGAWNNNNLSAQGYAATLGFENQVKIKKYYVSDDIMTTAKIHLTAQDAVMAFGSEVRTDGTGGRNVGSLVKFDFSKKILYICNKTDGNTDTKSYINTSFAGILSDTDLDFVLTVGRVKSRVFASIANYKTGKTVSLQSDTITESDFSPAGRFYDYLTFMQKSGTQAYWQNLYTYVPTNVKIAFIGDSITQGIYLPSVDESWVNILRKYYGNCVSSGRGGAKIDFIIDALNDGLIEAYNPQYVVVTIGTNEGNTVDKLNTVIDKIKEIGATPIVNCVSQTQDGKTTDGNENIKDVNANILALHQLGARFDIATGSNNNPEANATTAVLHDAVHPNSLGHQLMAERFKFDLQGLK